MNRYLVCQSHYNNFTFYLPFLDVNDPKWILHKKHVFVFSEAGKPIYSRYVNAKQCFLFVCLFVLFA